VAAARETSPWPRPLRAHTLPRCERAALGSQCGSPVGLLR